jgi:hypothetical protein
LYSKYDSLFKDLKTKEVQTKEKDSKFLINLETNCNPPSKYKSLASSGNESTLFRLQNKEMKENITLQRAISDLE